MTVTDTDFTLARAAGAAQQRQARVAKVLHDRESARLVVTLHNDVELAVPVHLIEGLAGVDPVALSECELSPSGLGIHWPALDADVCVPALFDGVFGSRSWMASILGAQGGRATSPAKAAAARANGRKGGGGRLSGNGSRVDSSGNPDMAASHAPAIPNFVSTDRGSTVKMFEADSSRNARWHGLTCREWEAAALPAVLSFSEMQGRLFMNGEFVGCPQQLLSGQWAGHAATGDSLQLACGVSTT